MQAEFFKNPVLKGLTKNAIDTFREEYRDYKERVESQGASAKPVSKYMCIPTLLRKSLAYQIGCKYQDLTPQQVFIKLDEICHVDVAMAGFDPEKVFHGLKMQPPRRRNEVKEKIQDYTLRIVECIEKYGIENEIHDKTHENFRKRAFSNIIKGIWPESLQRTLYIAWENDGKRWSMQQLLSQMDTHIEAVATYELDRLYNESEKRNENQKDKKSQYIKPQFSQPPRMEKKREYGDSQGMEKIRCYNCGASGHKRPDCQLRFNHPKAIEGRKSLINLSQKRLKRLQCLTEEMEHDHLDIPAILSSDDDPEIQVFSDEGPKDPL